jgi:hypothetical protein
VSTDQWSAASEQLAQRDDRLRSVGWLLMGLTGSMPGQLRLVKGMVSFVAFGRGEMSDRHIAALEQDLGRSGVEEALRAREPVTVFEVPLTEVTDVRFPWYYFGGGMKLTIAHVPLRFSFVRPSNTVPVPDRDAHEAAGITDVVGGKHVARAWRAALEPRVTQPTPWPGTTV